MKKVFLLVFLSSTAIATTNIKVETTPVKASISCDGKAIGVIPIRFTLEDGKHHCVFTHKLTEPVNFALDVNDEESIFVYLILIPGRMTEGQKKVSIHRVERQKGAYNKPPVGYSKEAEEFILSKKGSEAQRLINKLVELKQASSDGRDAVTASELNDLKQAVGGP